MSWFRDATCVALEKMKLAFVKKSGPVYSMFSPMVFAE